MSRLHLPALISSKYSVGEHFSAFMYDSMRHQDHAILLNGGLLLSRARTRYLRVCVHAMQTSRFKWISKVTLSLVHHCLLLISLHAIIENFQSVFL